MSEKFCRPDVLTLTGLTSNKLQYYERSIGIAPQRMGGHKKPYCLYTYEQVVLLASIEYLQSYKVRTSLLVKAIDKLFAQTSVRNQALYYAVERAEWDITKLVSELSIDVGWTTDLIYVPASFWCDTQAQIKKRQTKAS